MQLTVGRTASEVDPERRVRQVSLIILCQGLVVPVLEILITDIPIDISRDAESESKFG